MPDATTLPAVTSAHPQRPDPWAGPARERVCFRIVAEPETDILCRLLNGFAQQSLLPSHVELQRQGPLLTIEISQPDVSWHRAELIAQRMRGLIDVRSVLLQPCPSARTQRSVPA
ncbi:MAG: hypothetical protein ABWY06_14745 [Pseudomonas sp.]|uniref:hypothetical protein n=1 Tax=Pseudomonas sp. TaxID=306 RepID=UPI00339115BB